MSVSDPTELVWGEDHSLALGKISSAALRVYIARMDLESLTA